MHKYYVECPWPEPQLQIDWIDEEISVAAWLDITLGVTAWAWAPGPRDRIRICVYKPEHATWVKLHFS